MIEYGLVETLCPTVQTEVMFFTPGLGNTFKGWLTICNVTSAEQRASVSHMFDTGPAELGEWKFKDKKVPENDSFQIPITLRGTQTISVMTSNAPNSIAFTLDGQLTTVTP